MRLDPRVWFALALVLALAGIGWSVCGFSLDALPSEIPDPEDFGFQITRGCFFGPTLSLLLLAYLAFMAGRRDRKVRWSMLIVALLAALSLTFLIGGLALILGPTAAEERVRDNAMATLSCLLPGGILLAVAGVIWFWTRERA